MILQDHSERIAELEKGVHVIDKVTTALSGDVRNLTEHIKKLNESLDKYSDKIDAMQPTIAREKSKERFESNAKIAFFAAVIGAFLTAFVELIKWIIKLLQLGPR